jgi:hypothetical protein
MRISDISDQRSGRRKRITQRRGGRRGTLRRDGRGFTTEDTESTEKEEGRMFKSLKVQDFKERL